MQHYVGRGPHEETVIDQVEEAERSSNQALEVALDWLKQSLSPGVSDPVASFRKLQSDLRTTIDPFELVVHLSPSTLALLVASFRDQPDVIISKA